ncbi:MAG: biotin/lipoyl-binding carrier protein [Georgfuchsia sp.]
MAGQIRASMTGTIWKILVKEGDTFSAGDELVILESMKMEIPIETEVSGTVEKILMKEGDVIEEDAVIIIYI